MVYRIQHTASAKQDIADILAYLKSTLYSPAAARHFNRKLSACYRLISNNPLIYPVCRDEALSAKGFHFALVMRYILFFTVEDERKTVLIRRVLHGSMDYTPRLNF